MTDEKQEEGREVRNHEEWEQPEVMDEQQIADMMIGAFNLDLVNIYQRNGRQIEALSLKGVLEAANLRGGISIDVSQGNGGFFWEYDADLRAWRVICWVKDLHTGVVRHGGYTQHVYEEYTDRETGKVTERYNEHAFTQALSKASRNAYDAHLTEDIVRPIIEAYKPYVDIKTGKPNQKYWQKVKGEQGNQSQQSGSGKQQSGGNPPQGSTQQKTQPKTPEEQLKYERGNGLKYVNDRMGLIVACYGSKEKFWEQVGKKYDASDDKPMSVEAWQDFNTGIRNITRVNTSHNRDRMMKLIDTAWAAATPPAATTEDDIHF